MKKTETLIAFLLILSGLMCLTMSGGFLLYPGTASFLGTFAQICLWVALPFIGIGLLYWHFGLKNKR